MDIDRALEIEIANLEALLGDRDTTIDELRDELAGAKRELAKAKEENKRIESSYQGYIKERWG